MQSSPSCGPIAFDVGKMIANLLIAYFASWDWKTAEASRQQQRQWLLQVSQTRSLAAADILEQQRAFCIMTCRIDMVMVPA